MLTWISHGCACIPHPETPSHLPPHRIAQGCLSAPALSTPPPAPNLDWWSISNLIIYMFQCYSLKSSCPRLLPQSLKVCSLHLCLFCCLTYRVSVTIILNSIYMHWYTELVFFFLTYFTLYNRLNFAHFFYIWIENLLFSFSKCFLFLSGERKRNLKDSCHLLPNWG